ncbi:MAG TPA: asparagine--tRNA ligase [Spirochaetota bacterium]|nr:asparagine--tRNA ligase [Spirochaetota bacterium]HPJ35836.1 asparagine--tRNA ligase [Spirochaetota bacterium]
MKDKTIKHLMTLEGDGREVTVEGWIRTKRDSKDVSFLAINDGSCMSSIQVVLEKSFPGFEEINGRLVNGASVSIKGKLVPSQGKEQSVEVAPVEITVLGDAPVEEYPLQKKRHSFEFLREIAHLRPRTNTFGSVMRVRNAMSFAIHKYFNDNGFTYIHTPVITGSDCEGAGEMFRVTTFDLNNIPKSEGKIDFSQDFFGKEASLTVSGQLEAEIYALALKNVYTFGPTFRAENSNTSRHLAEFWMIEPEMAFCDINGNMDAAESFIKYILNYVLENCAEDMKFFNSMIEKGIIDNLQHIVESKFERITYTDAINELEKAGQNFEYPVKWGIDLQSEHEKYLTGEVFKKPVIVTDYPKEIKAFYMKLNDDGKTVRAMDVLVPRLGEIIGGSERENDYNKLLGRIKELGLHEEDYWWYLELRKYGSVPHSGFGLGFERLIQFVTGMQNIRDVIPFPRCVDTLDF